MPWCQQAPGHQWLQHWVYTYSVPAVYGLKLSSVISWTASHSPKNYSAISIRADSRLVPSQWETLLQCNALTHWLGANLQSALYIPKLDLYDFYFLCVFCQHNLSKYVIETYLGENYDNVNVIAQSHWIIIQWKVEFTITGYWDKTWQWKWL